MLGPRSMGDRLSQQMLPDVADWQVQSVWLCKRRVSLKGLSGSAELSGMPQPAGYIRAPQRSSGRCGDHPHHDL